MQKDGLLGAFEELVLLAVAHEGHQAYGMTVRREIERRAGRDVAIGAVYATLNRMEKKGYVASRAAESDDAARRGQARRYFRLRPAGADALLRTREVHQRMWEGLDLTAMSELAEAP